MLLALLNSLHCLVCNDAAVRNAAPWHSGLPRDIVLIGNTAGSRRHATDFAWEALAAGLMAFVSTIHSGATAPI